MTTEHPMPSVQIKNIVVDDIDLAVGLAIYVFIKRSYMAEIDIKRIARRFRLTEKIVTYELQELVKKGIFKK